jgi:hypothetical protein
VLHHLLLGTVLFAFNTHLIALRLLGLDWRTTVLRQLLDWDGFWPYLNWIASPDTEMEACGVFVV